MGAVFDRTKDGLISQRNFGGHRYPRLAHVGDRTGLELIRTLQDHGIHQGFDVHMECTALDIIKDGDRVAGLVGYWRETGRLYFVQGKSYHHGNWWRWKGLVGHFQFMGIHR